jgi:hypothetical protein
MLMHVRTMASFAFARSIDNRRIKEGAIEIGTAHAKILTAPDASKSLCNDIHHISTTWYYPIKRLCKN